MRNIAQAIIQHQANEGRRRVPPTVIDTAYFLRHGHDLTLTSFSVYHAALGSRKRTPAVEATSRHTHAQNALCLLARGRDAELFQPRRYVSAGGVRVHALVDMEDLALSIDVVRPSMRQLTLGRHHSIRLRDVLTGIAQKRVVEREGFRKLFVGLGRIAACSKVIDGKSPNRVAALTERLAFARSPTGESFWKPCKDDSLALQIREPVRLSVGTLELEVRRRVANVQLGGNRGRRKNYETKNQTSHSFHRLILHWKTPRYSRSLEPSGRYGNRHPVRRQCAPRLNLNSASCSHPSADSRNINSSYALSPTIR